MPVMRAAWYERQGSRRPHCQRSPVPERRSGEVRIKVAVADVNPGDVKKRRDEFRYGMPYPRVFRTAMASGSSTRSATACPRSASGSGSGAMARSPTVLLARAAKHCVVPEALAVVLPEHVSFEQGAATISRPLKGPRRRRHRAGSAGWADLPIAHRVPLTYIARAQELVDRPSAAGRVVDVSSVL
jgi:NADPH:quinone reductase-like Zn-dependent oxidoreductase